MSLRPEPLPSVPATTAAAVRAAFPKGNLYVDLRTEFGTLYHDQLFADLYPPEGRPVEVAPWRLALVMVMQYIEGLTDRQAADAVRRFRPSCTIFASGYWPMRRSNDSWTPSWRPVKPMGGSKHAEPNAPIPRMCSLRSVVCTTWNVSKKPCGLP